MTLEPLLQASIAVQIHVATVVPSFFITAIAAIFIRHRAPGNPLGLSWIHLFVPLTLAGIAQTVYALRTHNVRWHRGSMIGMYVGALVIAGALAFSPGRIMNEIVFGG